MLVQVCESLEKPQTRKREMAALCANAIVPVPEMASFAALASCRKDQRKALDSWVHNAERTDPYIHG